MRKKNKYPSLYKKIRFLYQLYLQNMEAIIRSNGSEIFVISEKGKKVKLLLPNKGDGIQQKIIVSKRFYEVDILKAIEKYIDQNSVILDIGSNIGNHVVYFGRILDAKKIYAFEPRKDIFKVLEKNIELNELTNKVETFNFALGSKSCRATIDYDGKLSNNLGSTSIKQDNAGELKIKRLDDIQIGDKKVNFMKIDVEGFELQVLEGSLLTIQKHKPIIWVESFGEKYIKTEEFLTHNGFILKEELPNSNYIFVPI